MFSMFYWGGWFSSSNAPISHKKMKKKIAKKSTVSIAKGVRIARGKESQLQKKAGGSNVGRYKKVKKTDFAGPSGSAPRGSYPINTKKRARAALAYAHNAPNPAGIKAAVRRKYPSLKKGK